MDTFKQFRTLNMLYDEMKNMNESLEDKKNHALSHLKEIEHKYGIMKAQHDELLMKYDVVSSERQRLQVNYEVMRESVSKSATESETAKVSFRIRWIMRRNN
jgi:uncharacterized protein YukE